MLEKFIIDLNRCTGCNSCVAACKKNNKGNISHRKVYTYNELGEPNLSFYNFSLSCLHCENAPCIEKCPTQSIYHDNETGAILVDNNTCIGCHYCNFVCPFDEFEFNRKTEQIEKCNFCYPLLKENKKPACVEACRSLALNFELIDEDRDQQTVAALEKTEYFPKIKFVPLDQSNKKNEFESTTASTDINEKIQEKINKLPDALSKAKKKSLLIYENTYLVGVAALCAGIFRDFEFNFILWSILFLVAFFFKISSFRNPLNFLDVFNNWRKSAISIEMLGFILFGSLGILYWLAGQNQILGGFAFIFGAVGLLAIDFSYRFLQNTIPLKIHSSGLLLNLIWIAGLFSKFYVLFWTALILSFLLFAYQVIYRVQNLMPISYFSVVSKVSFQVALPIFLWFFNPLYGYGILIVCIIFGQIIERWNFYSDLKTKKPTFSIFKDMFKKTEK